MAASQTFAGRTQSFALYRLKSRAGEGFYLTLTFASAKIRPLFTVVFSYISRDCGDGFCCGEEMAFFCKFDSPVIAAKLFVEVQRRRESVDPTCDCRKYSRNPGFRVPVYLSQPKPLNKTEEINTMCKKTLLTLTVL